MKAEIQLVGAAKLPEYKTAGAVAFDIAITRPARILSGECELVETGLIIKPPAGYWWMVAARSSLFKRGLMMANNVSIVDPDFCGPEDEYKLVLYNFTKAPVHVVVGDRLAQGFFLPLHQVEFIQTTMTGPSRGGWGSTGKK